MKHKYFLGIIYFSLIVFTTNKLVAQNFKWKEEAKNRIDKYRKNTLNIKIVDKKQNPVDGAIVSVKQIKHSFQFGAVVEGSFTSSKYADKYKSTFLKLFNSAGFENGLKQKQRGNPKEKACMEVAKWFYNNNILLRGHALVYDGEKFLRKDEKKVLKNNKIKKHAKAQKLTSMLEKHINHGIKTWNVTAWDVLNEPIANHTVNDLTDTNMLVHWFKKADECRKIYKKDNIKLYVNENRIISGTTKNTFIRPKQYKQIIQKAIAEGAPIEGIGFQSRIKNGFIKPEEMFRRLNYFSDLNLPYQATEFEVRDQPKFKYTDEQKQQLVEQFMLIYLSHPNVEGIWHWTFNNNEKGTKPWALFNYNGTPTVCGKQWMRTYFNDLSTNKVLQTNKNGYANTRAFRGEYIIQITYKNRTQSVKAKFSKDQEVLIKI